MEPEVQTPARQEHHRRSGTWLQPVYSNDKNALGIEKPEPLVSLNSICNP